MRPSLINQGFTGKDVKLVVSDIAMGIAEDPDSYDLQDIAALRKIEKAQSIAGATGANIQKAHWNTLREVKILVSTVFPSLIS
jgi:hypothetical protein